MACPARGMDSEETLDGEAESQVVVKRKELEERQQCKEALERAQKRKVGGVTDKVPESKDCPSSSGAEVAATKNTPKPPTAAKAGPLKPCTQTSQQVQQSRGKGRGGEAAGEGGQAGVSKPAVKEEPVEVKQEVKQEIKQEPSDKAGDGKQHVTKDTPHRQTPSPATHTPTERHTPSPAGSAKDIAAEVAAALKRASTVDSLDPAQIAATEAKAAKVKDRTAINRRERFYKSLVSASLSVCRGAGKKRLP